MFFTHLHRLKFPYDIIFSSVTSTLTIFSCISGLLAANHFRFYWILKHFLIILKKIYTDYQILIWQVLFSLALQICLSILLWLALFISNPYMVIFSYVFLLVLCHISVAAFIIFFLLLIFRYFVIIYFSVALFVFILLGFTLFNIWLLSFS